MLSSSTSSENIFLFTYYIMYSSYLYVIKSWWRKMVLQNFVIDNLKLLVRPLVLRKGITWQMSCSVCIDCFYWIFNFIYSIMNTNNFIDKNGPICGRKWMKEEQMLTGIKTECPVNSQSVSTLDWFLLNIHSSSLGHSSGYTNI